MTEQTIFYLILGIIIYDFLMERILEILNRKSSKKPIPAALEGIYDKTKYERSQAYQRELAVFTFFSASVTFVLLFLSVYNGWFGYLDIWIRSFAPIDMLTTIIFFGCLYVISDIIGTPFSVYKNFVIEEKYGFNKMTIKTFILDKIKGYFLTLIIGGILLGALIYSVTVIGSNFWIYFWGVLIVFILFANIFYTSLILPLFNKLTPLEEGTLRQSIQNYCEKVKFPLKNIFVMDGSKRSGKGNAFFSGLGKKKKVVFFDTLIEKHSETELTAVFAHEVGHYKKKHIIYNIFFSIGITGLMLYIFSLMTFNAEVSWALGGESSSLHLNLLAFGILYSPISRLISIIGNIMSRKNEYTADHYAKTTYNGEMLVTALKKMTADHLSNLNPHPAYVFFHYSHPPLKERIFALHN